MEYFIELARAIIKQFKFMALFSAVFLFSAQAFSTNSLHGKVVLSGKGADKAKIEETVIFYEPDNKVTVEALSEPHKIIMKRKAYQPRISAIPVGSEVKISNFDSILHNAFSPSKPNQFDLGLYGRSDGKTHRFDHAGVVRIFCNVHFHMVAYTLVLDTPFYTMPNSDGEFVLHNLPPGSGRLTFWHERTRQVVKKLNLPIEDLQNASLVISKRRVPEHKKKSGSSYKKKRRRRGKYN